MNLKKKSRQELEERIEQLEYIISEKGIGSDYLAKAERIQRDLNLALVLAGTSLALGLTAWSVYKYLNR